MSDDGRLLVTGISCSLVLCLSLIVSCLDNMKVYDLADKVSNLTAEIETTNTRLMLVMDILEQESRKTQKEYPVCPPREKLIDGVCEPVWTPEREPYWWYRRKGERIPNNGNKVIKIRACQEDPEKILCPEGYVLHVGSWVEDNAQDCECIWQ